MVLQMSCPDTDLLFVASDLPDSRDADGEVAHWAHTNGYASPQPGQIYRVYRAGALTCEWRLIDRRTWQPALRPESGTEH